MDNVGALRGQARVQQGGYGDKEGSQGALHGVPVLHNNVMALRSRGQYICPDARVDGQEGWRLLVSLPAAIGVILGPRPQHTS